MRWVIPFSILFVLLTVACDAGQDVQGPQGSEGSEDQQGHRGQRGHRDQQGHRANRGHRASPQMSGLSCTLTSP